MSADAFAVLYRISQLFNSILEPGELLDRVMDEAIATMQAERGLVVLVDAAGRPGVAVARRLDGALDRALSELSRTALDEVLARREARVWLDAPGSFPAAQSVIIGQVRSIACAPLVSRDRLVGAIYLDSRTNRRVFADDILDFLRAFAAIAALALENARLHQVLVTESTQLRQAVREWHRFPEIIGRSEPMRRVVELMERVLPTDTPVLITGETGTGKELVARAIHFNGPRAEGPFVPVNCGAVPGGLLEAELFGHRRGAFTGAVTDRKGMFEAASGGTLLLDEIGELPLDLQPKLLRVLQDGELRRVGETKPFHVDVRVISSTGRLLPELVREGRFRDDLFYRLNVIPVHLPPLRERREDIPLLVNRFLASAAKRLDKQIANITPAAVERLCAHDWPGNVRELENVIERAVVLCPGRQVDNNDIVLASPGFQEPGLGREPTVAEVEKQVVLERLARFGGNRTRTAASLGISRRTLLNKLADWKTDDENGTLRDS